MLYILKNNKIVDIKSYIIKLNSFDNKVHTLILILLKLESEIIIMNSLN